METRERIKEKLHKLPTTPGVYLMKDIDGHIIYVGKAKNLKRRVSSYFLNTEKTVKTTALVENIYDFDYILAPSELDALALESTLIKKHQPFYNILLKDGKAYPFIKINYKEEYPSVEIVRKVKKDGAKYFGPYFSGIRAGELIKIIHQAFPLRQCKNNLKRKQSRECLNYSMGLCLAPCTRRVSPEEYRKVVDDCIDFLKGKDKKVEEILTRKMLKASEMEQFESAIIFRDRLKMVEKLKSKVILQLTREAEFDAISFVTNGEYSAIAISVVRGGKMVGCETHTIFDSNLTLSEAITSFAVQYYSMNGLVPNEILVPIEFQDTQLIGDWLEEFSGHKVVVSQPHMGVKAQILKNNWQNAFEHLEKQVDKDKYEHDFTFGACGQLKDKLSLQKFPHKIEGYDISNISGTNKVASMVVFIDGVPRKNLYRKFIIKTVEGADDFASMLETLHRRFENVTTTTDESFNELPDLIVIDGGKGQLSSAHSAMCEYGYNVEMLGLAKKEEEVYKVGESEPRLLDRSSYALRLLQRVRDESHRFAITFHRNRRQKITSVLESIDKIGSKTARELLLHFKSLDNIAKASLEELEAVVRRDQALAVYSAYHS